MPTARRTRRRWSPSPRGAARRGSSAGSRSRAPSSRRSGRSPTPAPAQRRSGSRGGRWDSSVQLARRRARARVHPGGPVVGGRGRRRSRRRAASRPPATRPPTVAVEEAGRVSAIRRKRPWEISRASAGGEADEGEPQRVGEAVARGGGRRGPSRPPPPGRRPVSTPSAAAMPISGAAAACQATRALAGASRAMKPATRAPVAIPPLVGESSPSRAGGPDRDHAKATAQTGPAIERPDRRSAEAAAAARARSREERRAAAVSDLARGQRRPGVGSMRGSLSALGPMQERGASILGVVFTRRHQRRPGGGSGHPRGARGGDRLLPLPCVLPLVPGYLSAVTGVSAAELDDADWRRVMPPALIFVASFSTIFILFGLTATGLGSFLASNKHAVDPDLRLADHRDGGPLRQLALHHPAEPRVARRGAALRGRAGAARSSPAPPSRSPGPPASARPSARSSPPPPPRAPGDGARCSWPSTPPASGSPSLSRPSPSRGWRPHSPWSSATTA